MDWLDSLSQNNAELEITLNNLRCEMARAEMEPLVHLGYSRGYSQPPTMAMSIAPEESEAGNDLVERVIASELPGVQRTNDPSVQVVPMTDPVDQTARTQPTQLRERESRRNRRTR